MENQGAVHTQKVQHPQGVACLSCFGVSKAFPVFDEGAVWRMVFGNQQECHSVMALNEVSLAVPKGKVVGVLGRNGAGKSTLLRTLGGVYHPTSGSVQATGTISGLFELGGLGHKYLTGREYAKRFLQFHMVQLSVLPELLDDIRSFSELGQDFERPIFTLSTGMAARLYFATATALKYDIYLLDEILAVGDEHFQSKCWSRFRERLNQGASGVLVTHDWTAVLKLCEESYLMDRGRIIESGPTEKVVSSYLRPTIHLKPEGARFSEDNPTEYFAESRQDVEFRFFVEVNQARPVNLAYSIELLRAGSRWEVLLLSENLPLASTVGRHEIRLKVPSLPLAPGRYYLNLFLNSMDPEGCSGQKIPCDARSWTHGNALTLIVDGKACNSVSAIPLEWTQDVVTGKATGRVMD